MKYKIGDKILVWCRADKSFIVDKLQGTSHPKKETDIPIIVKIINLSEGTYTIEVPNDVSEFWEGGKSKRCWWLYGDDAILSLVKKEKCNKCLLKR